MASARTTPKAAARCGAAGTAAAAAAVAAAATAEAEAAAAAVAAVANSSRDTIATASGQQHQDQHDNHRQQKPGQQRSRNTRSTESQTATFAPGATEVLTRKPNLAKANGGGSSGIFVLFSGLPVMRSVLRYFVILAYGTELTSAVFAINPVETKVDPVIVSDDGRFEARCDMLGETTHRVRIVRTEEKEQLTWAEVIELWSADENFTLFYIGTLASSPYNAFFWECPSTTASRAGDPFQHVTIRNPNGFPPADPTTFKALRNCTEGATSFPSLGGDATLISPCQEGPQDAYGNIAVFVRKASEKQKLALWKELSKTMSRVLAERGPKPTWLSTEGNGVPWLHIRLDSRPKYIHTQWFRREPDPFGAPF